MTLRIFTDRSRIITSQSCARRRWYEYHEGGTGIVPAKKSLPLAVGGSVHAGLAVLLREGNALIESNPSIFWGGLSDTVTLRSLEDHAVAAALADFDAFAGRLELDAGELAAMAPAGTDPELLANNRSAFDEYLFAEQRSLVEAIVRGYARRRLRPLLEHSEVLEVEREGEWRLADIDPGMNQVGDKFGACTNPRCRYMLNGEEITEGTCPMCHLPVERNEGREIRFMSRPDALLRDRESNQLYLLSFKTAASWDVRKARDIEHDMQGLSEGIEVERRLSEWFHILRHGGTVIRRGEFPEGCSDAMAKFLQNCSAPPRILGIRYEFLLKGDRWTDKDLAAELGLDVRSQRSHLIRGYLQQGMTAGDEQWNCSWEYLKEGGEPSKLYYKAWKSSPVWTRMPIKQWINWLDQSAMVQSTEGGDPRELGYSSPAQTTGYLAKHPLDTVFVPPILVYRSEDSLRDLVEQMEASEIRIAEGVAAVNNAADEDEHRSMLNRHFPQSLHACEYPGRCSYVELCHGGEVAKRDPLGTGLYQIRQANHPIENEGRR